jgi:hypothetical protein
MTATQWINALRPGSGTEIGLSDLVSGWLARGNLRPEAMWHSFILRLKLFGCFDAECDTARQAVSLFPDEPLFKLLLAESLLRRGMKDEALDLLDGIDEPATLHCDALAVRLRQRGDDPAERAARIDTLTTRLMSDGDWTDRHLGLVEVLVEDGAPQAAKDFLTRWLERWPIKGSLCEGVGAAAMLIGDPTQARAIFAPVWADISNYTDPPVGRFTGSIRPYDDAIEAELTARIEAAFALDDSMLAVIAPPELDPPPPGLRVMLLSYSPGALSNDIAEHFARSAEVAGVSINVHSDSALTDPSHFVGTDQQVSERLGAFVAALDRDRPDILIVDCCWWPILRGLTPAIAAELKARFGFRLVCALRDSHAETMPVINAWLPACDTMVVFDPLSPAYSPAEGTRSAKVIALPVPSQHAPFLDDHPAPDLGITFVGSVVWRARYLLLSVLMTEGIGLTAVFGPHRAVQTPDTRAYARLLARSRAVLNVSRHSLKVHLVTGRVWETIATGTLLIEQTNPATAQFFTPYRHYLPWTDVDDIVHIARFIERRPDLAQKIAAEAQAWAARHYSCERVWSGLLAHATRPLPADEQEADRRAAHDWLALIRAEFGA